MDIKQLAENIGETLKINGELTSLEQKAIKGIAKNNYHDGSDPIEHEIWADCLDCTSYKDMPKGKTLSGVISSLRRKGFICTDGECLYLTEKARPFI